MEELKEKFKVIEDWRHSGYVIYELQKISSAEEEFNNMPIEKAGRLFVQLSKAEADRKRTAYATKRKAELAFDQMEADLLTQVRQYPDLVDQLKDVLTQARARIANADTE